MSASLIDFRFDAPELDLRLQVRSLPRRVGRSVSDGHHGVRIVFGRDLRDRLQCRLL